MTYNIHHGANSSDDPSLDQIIEIIGSFEPDVVGLQEVDRHWSQRSGFADQVTEIAHRLDMHYFFAPIYDLEPEEGSERRQYGLAILSNFPLVTGRNLMMSRLTTISDEHQIERLGGFAHVSIDVDGRDVQLFNVHLDYRSDPSVRTVQVQETVAAIREADGSVVLMGDFNAEPGAAELDRLQEFLLDAWHGREGAGHTYPSIDPSKRIDYIFVSPGVQIDSAFVLTGTASDHRPVGAVIRLPLEK
jgi:endonuclease/exonuclease/phosphatase family metal-dependent hydrolase